ncbi:uncharacterized protein SOCEGT47_067830 [Sorangium cellulosum]|uniref:Carbohydrate kinase FGGY N-terminal domain-containing protein n=1 Tax=Sorangium cellulosum TaxID=56 RepID=A0A4V0NEH8_SORCE|nr:uncharacterized protein SOCEGT47_067830 [Sorangium cellulosum]
MDSAYLLAIDQGTTGTTTLLMDTAGATLGRATREFRQHFPEPGLVEHDPEEIWQTVQDAVGETLKAAGVAGSAIKAIGITNQRETTLVWERATGRPIHRAIVWQDRRTAARCAELRAAGHEQAVEQTTGLVLDPYFSGTKLAWILDSVPGARARRARRAVLRHRRQLPGLPPLGRRGRRLAGARDRRDQRVAHPAHEPRRAELGRRDALAARRPAPDPAGDRPLGGPHRGDSPLPAPARRRPDRRHRGRPAGGPLRPGLLRDGRRQVHLWHRRVRAGQHRRSPAPEPLRVAHLRGMADRLGGGLCAGGERLYRGRRGAVAPRRPGPHQERGGDRGARPQRALERGRHVRPGALRARRALLGPGRPGARLRRHARHDRGAPRPRDARGDRVLRGGSPARDGRRPRPPAAPDARGRRRRRERPAPAAPGGPRERHHRAPHGSGDDGPRRRNARRRRRRALPDEGGVGPDVPSGADLPGRDERRGSIRPPAPLGRRRRPHALAARLSARRLP